MMRSKLLSRYDSIDHVFLGRITRDISEEYAARIRASSSAEQVHGNSVTVATKDVKRYPGVDGLVTSSSGASLMIRTADCIPILLFDPSRRVIAAVHAGWKGLYGDIIASAVQTMSQLGGVPGNMIAVLGPHIGDCCYSVSVERIGLFVQKGFHHTAIVRQSGMLSYLNLAEIAGQQLEEAGITADHRETLGICTHCDKRFYSYRRDSTGAGRNISIIQLR